MLYSLIILLISIISSDYVFGHRLSYSAVYLLCRYYDFFIIHIQKITMIIFDTHIQIISSVLTSSYSLLGVKRSIKLHIYLKVYSMVIPEPPCYLYRLSLGFL
jgi:hypothetical protein